MNSNLVRCEQLAPHLEDPLWRIIDCRFDLGDQAWGAAAYQLAHLPGAVYADLNRDLSSPVTPESGRHPLPDPAAFAQRLAAWGIDEDAQVVAYDQGIALFASRLWWLLRACGHQRVAVLDGGLAAWKTAGLPLSEALRPPRPLAAAALERGGAAA
jgi:thiosulfate/3-mercaptopyruvate sulfurtransferase